MKKELVNTIDTMLLTLGISFGLEQIETMLGIIILSIQLIWIISKMACKIYSKIKSKKFNEIDDAIIETIEEMKELKEDIKKDGVINE